MLTAWTRSSFGSSELAWMRMGSVARVPGQLNGQQPGYLRSGSSLHGDAVVPDRRGPLGRAPQHHRRERVDHQLRRDRVGHVVRHGHDQLGRGKHPVLPGARDKEERDARAGAYACGHRCLGTDGLDRSSSLQAGDDRIAIGTGERPGDAGEVTGMNGERRYPDQDLAALRSLRLTTFHHANHLCRFA